MAVRLIDELCRAIIFNIALIVIWALGATLEAIFKEKQ